MIFKEISISKNEIIGYLRNRHVTQQNPRLKLLSDEIRENITAITSISLNYK